MGAVAASLRSVGYAIIVPALLALGLTVWLRALRWRALFDPATRPPVAPVTRALLLGLLFNSILPARAGEAVRVLALSRETGNARAEVLATAATERLFDVASLLVLFLVAAPFLPSVSWTGEAVIAAGALAGALASAVVALLVWGERPLRAGLRPLARWLEPARLDAVAANLVQGLAGLRKPRVAMSGMALSLASWLALALVGWLVLLGFDFGVGFGAAVLVVVATNLAMVIPSSPAGVGPFEAAVLVALAAFGVGRSQALSYAILFHAVNFVPFLPVGYAALQRHLAAVRH